MNRVLDRLWIGSELDLSGSTPFVALGFSGILDLRDGDHPLVPGVPVRCLQNRDGDPWSKMDVEGALEFVHLKIRIGRVLVACAAGKSRSASMVIGYLVATGWDFPSAFVHVKAVRPEIAPVQKMLDSVRAVVG